jgi:hypothetical protein
MLFREINAISSYKKLRTWVWTPLSSGMWQLGVFWKSTYVSEKHTISIFRIVEYSKQEPAARLLACSICFSTLKIERICCSEWSVNFCNTTRRHIPEYLMLFILRIRNMRQSSWLRCYATSQKDVGSTPDEVIGFSNWSNPSSRTVTLASTQPLAENKYQASFWG